MNNQFKIHQITGQIQQIFLAEYPDKILLMDAGCRCDASVIEDFIRNRLNRSMQEVKLLVVSHAHPDHAGGNLLLRAGHRIPIAASRDIDLWYSGAGGWTQHKIDTTLAYMVGIMLRQPLKWMHFDRKVRPDYLLEDGDPLPFFEDWRVLLVPGHTSHDIVLYNQERSLLYASDVVLLISGNFTLPLAVTQPELMKRSLGKLAELKIETILMAHGGSMALPQDRNIFQSLIPLVDMRRRSNNPRLKVINFVSGFSPELKKESSQ